MTSRYTVIILLFVLIPLWSQKKIEVLNTDLSGANRNYIARDAVFLNEGFKYYSGVGQILFAETAYNLIPAIEHTNPTNPDTRQINTNLPVGTIQHSFSVSSSGAAVCDIPIYTSPGTGGVKPDISVSYNSQSGSGLLGWGWNLAGVSAISRVGQTIYHDGKTGGINLDLNDRYSWDGKRLIVVNGFYGTASSEYKTEIESYAKITASTSMMGNGPEWFTIETKEGTIIEFGKENNARLDLNGSGVNWMISKIKDPNGNYIRYYYNIVDHEQRLDRIEYTGNDIAGLEPFNVIYFKYVSKPGSCISYIAGQYIKQTLILDQIQCFSQGLLAHQYDFKYSVSWLYPCLLYTSNRY